MVFSDSLFDRQTTALGKVLLLCGILSSLLWISGDIVASIQYEGYSFVSQSISELSAIGAPTRSLLFPLGIIYEILLFTFGLGVLTTGGRKRAQRFTGILLMTHAIVGLVSVFFPMTLRGGELTISDIMHIIFYTLIPLIILLTVGFGANIHGKRFRIYSIVTILILIICWVLTAMASPRIAAGLPTPWVGIYERLNVYGYMQWVLVLAISLLRTEKG
ncbi:MAG TPA: DUF998 domain-containing protein [Desulfitobacteriaceae bacterium]|nr:DUF998 domain-containing protein [Desulfitobacteriaceae bacterium]